MAAPVLKVSGFSNTNTATNSFSVKTAAIDEQYGSDGFLTDPGAERE